MRKAIVFPGQKVICSSGEVATIAMIAAGRVYVYGVNGWLKAVDVCGDAWGGEVDQSMGLDNAA